MARQIREREYGASDLRELMDSTGGWAKNWGDVLRYLEGPGERKPGFLQRGGPQLIEDVRHLRDDDIRFTTDYRTMWKELTGRNVDDLPPPRRMQPDSAESADRYLHDPDPSADKGDVVHAAEKGKASSRVLDVLQRVESREYKEMAELLESTGDFAWNHKR